MLKLLVTLFRGVANGAADGVAARNALVILDQQIRDAGSAVRAAQLALANAMAEGQRDAGRLQVINQRIAGLEDRTRAALAGGREDLARLAAATIAELETDRDAAAQAGTLFADEIERLRETVGEATRRLRELHRGRRLAAVGDAVRRARSGGINIASLQDAEATLAALRTQQETHEAADDAFDDITAAPGQIENRLSQAGFGPAVRPTADSVLQRLRPLAITKS
jgi:phage shock protein A